jgi:2-desacetyl-2-hydroxyethyl bacteriochlorophyllide A dehydrogenase
MKAACIPQPGTVRVIDFPDPHVTEPTDALVRVTTAGVCGTDLHRLDRVAPVHAGLVLGHEFVGVVEEVGSAVSGVVPGGRYLGAMYVACGRCASCQRGEHPNCPSFAMFGTVSDRGTLQGAQADYVRVPIAAMTLTAVPDDVSDEQILPVGDILATAYDAVRGGASLPGADVVVVGAGPVGQLVIECALMLGAARVFAIDISPARVSAAEGLGAIALQGDGAVEAVQEMTSGRGANVVVEAVGAAPAIETALSVAARGGHVALVGVPGEIPFPVSVRDCFLRRLTVRGVIGNPYRYRDELIRLVEAGRLQPERVITHRMPLSQAAQAYRDFGEQRANKVVLVP